MLQYMKRYQGKRNTERRSPTPENTENGNSMRRPPIGKEGQSDTIGYNDLYIYI